jgi:hypothetical protein
MTDAPDALDNETIRAAGRWLADQSEHIAPIVPELRTRFGLTTPEAIEAIRVAQKMRVYQQAHA